jgi:heterodisulfide reductase subunit A
MVKESKLHSSIKLKKGNKIMEGSVLVIGGGVVGIQTSLDLTELGFKVYLVEKKPTIGGHVAQLEKTFPNMDCALCILTPKMVSVYKNPNIDLFTLSKVKEISGEAGNFKVTIIKKPRYINERLCRGCGDCAAKCPKVEAPNYFDMNLGRRKSVYLPFPQATPPTYLIDPKLCLYINREVCGVCRKICKAEAINYEQEPEEIEFKVGAIVVATGFDILGEELTPRWGYQYENVLNSLEYERILCSSGPFGGQVLRPSDHEEPQKIAFIQCAGSLDLEEGVPYCSRVCCSYTAKEAVLTRMYSENIETYIFRHRFRAFGKNYYEFAKRAQKEFGIKYLQTKIINIQEEPKTKDLIIHYKDLATGENKEFNANMIILATPLVYSSGTQKLAKILDIKLDKYGFFQEKSYYEKSLSSKDGIFLCGCCQSPMDISETVVDGSAVASQVANLLNPAKFTQIKEREIDTSQKEDIIEIKPAALIIGGGISGMTAAHNIANQGFKTYIIEKENVLGGNLNKINMLYPIQEDASKILNEVKTKVENNEKIQVFLNTKVTNIEGSIGNYIASIVNVDNKVQEINIGTIIIATGSKEFKPVGLYQYSDLNKNVLTQLELEQRLKNDTTDWIKEINHVTSILCVNARYKGGFSYCSNVCCSNTIKNINILEAIKPELKMLVVFRDLHMAKKEFEEFFDIRKKTAKYIRYSPSNLPEITKIKKDPERYQIKLRDYNNPEREIVFMTDLIILSTPMVPADDLKQLASMINVPLDETGFFLEAHAKLRPLDFANDGIFLCGCAQWPKNVQDSISQANGAAGRASRFLSLKKISSTKLKFLSFLLSIECHFKDLKINQEKCNGCGRCKEICSFKAIDLIESEQKYEDVSLQVKKAVINRALCKGCGKCTTVCRPKAISARHYNFNQISSIIDPYFLEREETKKISSMH